MVYVEESSKTTEKMYPFKTRYLLPSLESKTLKHPSKHKTVSPLIFTCMHPLIPFWTSPEPSTPPTCRCFTFKPWISFPTITVPWWGETESDRWCWDGNLLARHYLLIAICKLKWEHWIPLFDLVDCNWFVKEISDSQRSLENTKMSPVQPILQILSYNWVW